MIPLVVGVRFGWRACPPLIFAALITLALHSFIGHKEYRFVYLTTATLVILSAVGWGVLVDRSFQIWAGIQAKAIAALVLICWTAASLLLTHSDRVTDFLERGRPGSILFATIRHDPSACGVALVDRPAFADVPGRVSLRRNTQLFMFLRGDPALIHNNPWASAMQWQGGFNRIIAVNPSGYPPPGYRLLQCATSSQNKLCLMARNGSCTETKSPFLLDRAMIRLGF